MRRGLLLGLAGLSLFSASLAPAQNSSTSAKAPAAPAGKAAVPAPEPASQTQSPFDAYQQFSASVSGGPVRWKNRKIYRSGSKMRVEYEAEDEVRISNLAGQNGWVIRPRVWQTKPRECSPMTLMDAPTYPFSVYTGKDFSVEHVVDEATPAVDKEIIDGHSCKIEKYVFKHKQTGITIKVKLWEAEDLKDFPIKMEIEPASRPVFTFTYSDVSVEPPDPKLFQLPAMCRAGVQKKKPAAAAPKSGGEKAPSSNQKK